jgi:hypothetical protein
MKREEELQSKATKLGYKTFRSYDFEFKPVWSVYKNNEEVYYTEYTLDALQKVLISLDRQDKLNQLGI